MTATFDEALEMLRGTGPEFEQDEYRGLSNHGPMAAEAMFALNRPDVVLSWVEDYRRDLSDHPAAGIPISPTEWRDALGDYARLGDWRVYFERELEEAPWTEVLDRWLVRLAPGLVAAATHGVIRTGHAARGLGDVDNELRRGELAEGLAYWAARFEQLPEPDARSAPPFTAYSPKDAIGRVPLSDPKRRSAGLIMDTLRQLDDMPSFRPVIDLVDTTGDPSLFISQLTEQAAGIYLAAAPGSGRAIALIHGLTGPSALRLIEPHVSTEAIHGALRYAWQTTAAIYSVFGDTPALEVGEFDRDAEAFTDEAIETADPHAIKFAEACRREYLLNPNSVYLRAAADAATRLRD